MDDQRFRATDICTTVLPDGRRMTYRRDYTPLPDGGSEVTTYGVNVEDLY